MESNSNKAKYGIDAPGVIRNLLIIGVAICSIVVFFPLVKIGSVNIDTRGLLWSGGGCCFGGVLMLTYSLYGKFKHRDRMLNYVSWKGNEQVLDVGTGKGLLMIGAAKRLTTGKSIGIDIWNEEDLSGNNIQNALHNAEIEGVSDKVEVKNENVMDMSFADNTFDVILTNMCIHNIYNVEGRKTACEEIGRVLKKGGTAIVSDWRHVKEYNRNFKELGLQTQLLPAQYLTTFPAITTVIVKK
jgi:ubiquinone/menaquinone biosynthesis C-methylase UbiE